MTRPDKSRFEQSHRWPVFLPDGKHFIYLAANFTGQLENNAIFLGSLDSQERRLLVSTSANAAYAEPGYLLYLRDNKTLVAQPFDRRRISFHAPPFFARGICKPRLLTTCLASGFVRTTLRAGCILASGIFCGSRCARR